MKENVLKILTEEKSQIEKEIEILNLKINDLKKELTALDIVLSRNNKPLRAVMKTKIGTFTMSANDINGHELTKSERRTYDALEAIGGRGTARDIHTHLVKIYPYENKEKLYSSARQYASKLNKDGVIGAEEQGGNKPNIYFIKENEVENIEK